MATDNYDKLISRSKTILQACMSLEDEFVEVGHDKNSQYLALHNEIQSMVVSSCQLHSLTNVYGVDQQKFIKKRQSTPSKTETNSPAKKVKQTTDNKNTSGRKVGRPRKETNATATPPTEPTPQAVPAPANEAQDSPNEA